jgi:hypothetical protein
MAETLTVLALRMQATLQRTLRSTNVIESMIDIGATMPATSNVGSMRADEGT